MSNMPPNDPNSNQPNSDQNPLGQPPVKQDGNPYATPAQQQQPYATMPQNDSDATGGIIPYKNPKALIAYYTSIFSLLFPPLGFVAVILGILGLMDRKKNPRHQRFRSRVDRNRARDHYNALRWCTHCDVYYWSGAGGRLIDLISLHLIC